jgi:hypothetical protein
VRFWPWEKAARCGRHGVELELVTFVGGEKVFYTQKVCTICQDELERRDLAQNEVADAERRADLEEKD